MELIMKKITLSKKLMYTGCGKKQPS